MHRRWIYITRFPDEPGQDHHSLECWLGFGPRVIPLIADFVLFIHFCIVIFVTSAFFFIPIGYKFDWSWVSNIQMRILHSGMMAFITLETLLGITCPLTSIENSLRGIYQSESFVGYWLKQIVFWDFPTQFFIILYSFFLGWTCLMWKLFPPTNNQRS